MKARDLPAHLRQQLGEPPKVKRPSEASKAAELLAYQMRLVGLEGFQREHRFAPPRMWRFDFAHPALKIAVEVEGLVVRRNKDGSTTTGGRHANITGFRRDTVKYARAAILGWYVVRFEQTLIRRGVAIQLIEQLHQAAARRMAEGTARHG